MRADNLLLIQIFALYHIHDITTGRSTDSHQSTVLVINLGRHVQVPLPLVTNRVIGQDIPSAELFQSLPNEEDITERRFLEQINEWTNVFFLLAKSPLDGSRRYSQVQRFRLRDSEG